MGTNNKEVSRIAMDLDLDSFVLSFKLIANSTGVIAYIINNEDKVIGVSHGFLEKFGIGNEDKLLNQLLSQQNFYLLQLYAKYPEIFASQNKLVRNSKVKKNI